MSILQRQQQLGDSNDTSLQDGSVQDGHSIKYTSLNSYLLPPTPFPRGIPNRHLHYIPPILSSLQEAPHDAPGLRQASLTPTTIALHSALTSFKPTSHSYATMPYEDAFNWNEINLPIEASGTWYAVAFRSRRASDADDRLLYESDRKSMIEAVKSGGLVMYWYGIPSANGDCLATCIWTDQPAARRANSRPDHARAARLARTMYEKYTLERYKVVKEAGRPGLYITQWE